jgi:ubiquinone biosynthesis monooxygenase Coq7
VVIQTDGDRKTIARILKVNHAGESGAIRIYQAQLFVCGWLRPSITDFLTETLGHEIEHCRIFRKAMPSRNARPCRAMWLWSIGGWLLGFSTALAGEQFVWICTEAVEETVHRHLDEQLNFLNGRDNDLALKIASIQGEELSHLNHAKSQIVGSGSLAVIVYRVIVALTESVIWLSTQGDSAKMASAIRKSHD